MPTQKNKIVTEQPSTGLIDVERLSLSSEGTNTSSCGSDIVMIDDRLKQTVPAFDPVVKTLNVTKSSGITVGPQFVSVNQNIDKINVVKDLPCHRYTWHLLKNTTKAEKASCATALLVLIVCIALIVYFSVTATKPVNNPDNVDPKEWFVERERWLATEYNKTERINHRLRLVIIAHTVGPTCSSFFTCIKVVKSLQDFFLSRLNYDIPYSFLIGHDGRVYEGRGWNIVGAHTSGYNYCSMGLAFMGDYREGHPSYSNVTDLQQQRAHMLFEEGVKNGYLHPDFHVLGAMDLTATLSPGTNLYKAIQKWARYDHENLYKDKNCTQILEQFEGENATSVSITPAPNVVSL